MPCEIINEKFNRERLYIYLVGEHECFFLFFGLSYPNLFFFKDKTRGDARVFYLLVRVYLLLHSKKNDIFIIFLNKIFINESCQTNIIIYYLLADVASVIFPRGFYSSL